MTRALLPMILAAALVVAVGWFLLSAFLSMANYIPSVLP